jgi:hypothetical protein
MGKIITNFLSDPDFEASFMIVNNESILKNRS